MSSPEQQQIVKRIFIVLVALAVLWVLDVVARYGVLALTVPPGLGGKLLNHLANADVRHFANLVYALVVGLLGAAAFYFGVFIGFIGRDTRDKTLAYFGTEVPASWVLIVFFCLAGGVVAAVFQLAQVDNFAPIQAFVLGATWPSVVTRIMSGEGRPTVPGDDLLDRDKDKIPNPAGRSARGGQVVINPKTP